MESLPVLATAAAAARVAGFVGVAGASAPALGHEVGELGVATLRLLGLRGFRV